MDGQVGIKGFGEYVVVGPDGHVKARGRMKNLQTQVGDRYWAERAAGIAGAPAQITGMRLGTDNVPSTKTGAGAKISTYLAGSAIAIDVDFPVSSLSGSSRRITFQCTWEDGDAESDNIQEVVLTNETPLTDSAGTEADTIGRGILSPPAEVGSVDTFIFTYHVELIGTA